MVAGRPVRHSFAAPGAEIPHISHGLCRDAKAGSNIFRAAERDAGQDGSERVWFRRKRTRTGNIRSKRAIAHES